MPKLPVNRLVLRRGAVLAAASLLATAGLAALPAAASANSSQISIIQDDSDLTNPSGAMAQFRALGANTVRVFLPWAMIAPDYSARHKPNFDATDPNAYPSAGWTTYDNLVKAASADNLTVDLTVTGGAPLWASGPGIPPQGKDKFFAWKPNAADYGQFVQAVGTRYSGHFIPKGQSSPLPRVTFWSIYNEPNFGEDLGPQATDGSRIPYAALMFRNLLNAGWNALHATGHGHDTILFGEFAARGNTFHLPWRTHPDGLPGDYGQTKPLIFIRDLYCVGSNYRPLRGAAARGIGCPTNSAGSARFRGGNPALFSASGVSDHPYPSNLSPVVDGLNDPNFAAFPELPKLGRELDRVNSVYGSHTHFPIYNTEYGYITRPPSPRAPDGGLNPSPTTASWYINWAEYLSWKNSRIKSYMQYLLTDPLPNSGVYTGFASGLETYNGRPKATYYAFRMPLYMPHTNISHKQNVEVWGDVRPAPFATLDGFGPQTVSIQLQPAHQGWETINTVKLNRPGGYFDVRMKFPTSGLVRTQWTYPHDGLLPSGFSGINISSRSFSVKVH